MSPFFGTRENSFVICICPYKGIWVVSKHSLPERMLEWIMSKKTISVPTREDVPRLITHREQMQKSVQSMELATLIHSVKDQVRGQVTWYLEKAPPFDDTLWFRFH